MALHLATRYLTTFICSVLAVLPSLGRTADPDPVQDFCVADLASNSYMNGYPCKDPKNVTTEDFVSQILSRPGNFSASRLNSSVTALFVEEFPGFNTLGLSMARLDVGAGGLVAPHMHPRGSEVIFIVQGSLYAGFITASNQLFAKVIGQGEVMIFPRGLIHFQLNLAETVAIAVVALNSHEPGFQTIADSLFGSNEPLPDTLLEKAFGLTADEVHRVKSIYVTHH